MSKHFFRGIAVSCFFVLVSGCGPSTLPVDRDPTTPPPPDGIKVLTVPDKQLRVLPPTVEFSSDVMNVSGYVRRKPGVRGIITGRVDIQVLDSEGNELDWIPALLTPISIPSTGRAESTYIIHYGWIPPQGSTIKVSFVDSKTAVIEDTNDGDSPAGTYGSRTGGRSATSHSHWR